MRGKSTGTKAVSDYRRRQLQCMAARQKGLLPRKTNCSGKANLDRVFPLISAKKAKVQRKTAVARKPTRGTKAVSDYRRRQLKCMKARDEGLLPPKTNCSGKANLDRVFPLISAKKVTKTRVRKKAPTPKPSRSAVYGTYVLSPETTRKIKVGGTTYNRLKSEGYDMSKLQSFKSVAPHRRGNIALKLSAQNIDSIVARGRWKPPTLQETLHQGWATEPSKIRTLKKQIANQKTARRSATRGWGAVFPTVGPQRRRVYSECGQDCFLLPNPHKPGASKFPICPKCLGDSCACQIDCRGVVSAKIRAKQYGYDNVSASADRISNKLGCK